MTEQEKLYMIIVDFKNDSNGRENFEIWDYNLRGVDAIQESLERLNKARDEDEGIWDYTRYGVMEQGGKLHVGEIEDVE